MNPRARAIDRSLPFDQRFFESPFGRQGLWREGSFLAKPAPLPAHARVVVVGGGIHGVGLALNLRAAGLPAESLAILTREPGLLLNFQHYVDRLALGTLRSDYTHTLDGEPQGMRDFARRHTRFLTPYEREQLAIAEAGGLAYPPTDIFFGHAQQRIAEAGLLARTFQSDVTAIRRTGDRFEVSGSAGTITADALIVSLGLGTPALPAPMRALAPRFPDRIKSAFELAPDEPAPGETVLLVGGAQTAVGLMETVCRVEGRLIFDWRDEPRVSPYDVDETLLTEAGVARWQGSPLRERAEQLRDQHSTITAPYAALLCQLAEAQVRLGDGYEGPRLEIKDGPNLEGLAPTPEGRFLATFDDGSSATIDRAYAAIGFAFAFRQLPCLAPLADAIPTLAGFPVADDTTLQVGPWPLFFGGRANTLAIGPAAVQIAGVPHEARRIVPAILRHLGGPP